MNFQMKFCTIILWNEDFRTIPLVRKKSWNYFSIWWKKISQSPLLFWIQSERWWWKIILLRTKSTLWWPGGHVTWSRGSRDPEGKPLERNPYVMRSAHSPPPRVTCKVAKVVVWFHYLIDSAEKTLWVKRTVVICRIMCRMVCCVVVWMRWRGLFASPLMK